MFRQMDLKGQSQIDTQLKTVHQNTINTIRVYEETGGVVRKFCSKDALNRPSCLNSRTNKTTIASGVDGRVVIWSI